MTTYRRNGEPDGIEEAMASIAASAPEATVQTVPVAMPSLEESVNEQLEKNEEYQRAALAETRDQIRQAVQNAEIRKRNQAEIAADTRAAYQASREADVTKRGQELQQDFAQLTKIIPPELQHLSLEDQITDSRMPPGASELLIKTAQRMDAYIKETGINPLDALMQQAAPQTQPQPTVQPQPAPHLNQQPEPTQANSIAEFWADEQAKTLGFSNKQEMVQWGQQMTQFREEFNDSLNASQFLANCPEFPNTVQASENIASIIAQNNWKWDADSMQAAHAIAVQRNLYQPLSPAEQQASIGNAPQNSRPAPPPMVRSQNPESYVSHLAPEQMTAQQARAEYFRLLSEQKAGQYR